MGRSEAALQGPILNLVEAKAFDLRTQKSQIHRLKIPQLGSEATTHKNIAKISLLLIFLKVNQLPQPPLGVLFSDWHFGI